MSKLVWRDKEAGAHFGSELWRRDKRLAWTFNTQDAGWCWCAPSDDRLPIKWRNSYAEGATFASHDEAMADAGSYIASCLRDTATRVEP